MPSPLSWQLPCAPPLGSPFNLLTPKLCPKLPTLHPLPIIYLPPPTPTPHLFFNHMLQPCPPLNMFTQWQPSAWSGQSQTSDNASSASTLAVRWLATAKTLSSCMHPQPKSYKSYSFGLHPCPIIVKLCSKIEGWGLCLWYSGSKSRNEAEVWLFINWGKGFRGSCLPFMG